MAIDRRVSLDGSAATSAEGLIAGSDRLFSSGGGEKGIDGSAAASAEGLIAGSDRLFSSGAGGAEGAPAAGETSGESSGDV